MAEKPNNIAKIRKMRGWSQQQLAERFGAHAITISNLERGQAPLTEEWLRRLSETLMVEEGALLKVDRPQKVFVGAEIGRSRLVFWETEKEVFGPDSKFAIALGKTPPISADIPRWTVVNDDAFYPVFRHLDVIRLVPLIESSEKEIAWAKGRLCVVLAEEESGKPVMGYLQPTSKVGAIVLDPIGRPALTFTGSTLIYVVDRAIYQPDFPTSG